MDERNPFWLNSLKTGIPRFPVLHMWKTRVFNLSVSKP
jgi:hypothetical protein